MLNYPLDFIFLLSTEKPFTASKHIVINTFENIAFNYIFLKVSYFCYLIQEIKGNVHFCFILVDVYIFNLDSSHFLLLTGINIEKTLKAYRKIGLAFCTATFLSRQQLQNWKLPLFAEQKTGWAQKRASMCS